MVEVDDVDGVDCGVRVGIGRQQHAAREREEVHRLLEKLDAAHLWHAVVGDKHGYGVSAQLEFLQCVERVAAGLGSHDAITLAIVPTKVTGDCTRHSGVVVDGEDCGSTGLYSGSSHR